jgi:hypothetical protein
MASYNNVNAKPLVTDVNTNVTLANTSDIGGVDGNPFYANAGLQNDIAAGADVRLFSTPSDLRSIYTDANPVPNTSATTSSADVPLGSLFDSEQVKAYLNKDGGWAAASKAMHALLENVQRMGAKVIPGARMIGFSSRRRDGGGDSKDSKDDLENRDTIDGVVLEDGTQISADIIVLAMGAWTPSAVAAIPQLSGLLQDKLTATG